MWRPRWTVNYATSALDPDRQSGIDTRMPRGRRYELDELIIRPGTYFNPQTEVMIVVDDSP